MQQVGVSAVLRIHVSGVDLSRVRMATRPDAMWETILSFHRLRDRRGSTVFGKWRKESRTRLNGEARLLSAVVPPRGYFPDFLTPAGEGAEPLGLDAGIEVLRDTPTDRIRGELALLTGQGAAGRRHTPGSLPEVLAEGRTEPLGGSSPPCAPTTAPRSSRTGRTSGRASRPTGRSGAAPCWTVARTNSWRPCRR